MVIPGTLLYVSALVLQIIIAHESPDDAAHAKELVGRLGCRLGSDYLLQPVAWKFELLESRYSQDYTLSSAADIDILMIAAKGSLPEHVKRWIERWALSERIKPFALVALSNPSPGKEGTNEALDLDFLRQIAARAKAQFFCLKDWLLDDISRLKRTFALEAVRNDAEYLAAQLEKRGLWTV